MEPKKVTNEVPAAQADEKKVEEKLRGLLESAPDAMAQKTAGGDRGLSRKGEGRVGMAKILVVDDHPINRHFLVELLSNYGYDVLEAADGVEALAVLEREQVDAVISDILMPNMDGYRLCYEVRTSPRFCHIPFIIYTASYTSPSDEKLSLELGADKFLIKPAPAKLIIAALHEVRQSPRRKPKPIAAPAGLNLMKEYNERLVTKLEQKNNELAANVEALLKTEQQLRMQGAALETTADGVMITDLKGLIFWVNPAFTTLTGYAADEVLGRNPRLLKSGQHDRGFYKNLWETILRGETWRGSFRNRRKDGNLYDDEHTITPIKAKDGTVTHFVAIMHDVTERKHAETALRASEELFRNAFDHTNVPMVLTDLDHRFVRANTAFARLFGYTQLQVLNLTMMDITHPEDVGESFARRKSLLSGEVPYFQTEKRYRHKDGRVLWGLTNVSLVRDSQGRPYQYVGQVQDITERKRAEEAIVSYNERLKILHQIDRAMIAGEESVAIAEAVLPLVRDQLGVARVVVNLFDLATGEVEWLAAAGRRRVHAGPGVRYPIRLMGDVEALRRGERQLIDVQALPPGPEVDALLASGVHSYVVVPMIASGDLIGALSFGRASGPFSTEQIGIAQEVATQFAIALTHARLHERVKSQAQELQVQNQTLTTLIDASPLAIIVVDVQGRVTVWSHAAEQIFGWPAAEVLGQPVPFVPLEKQEELRSLLAMAMAGKATTGLETYRLRRDGTQVDVVVSTAPLFDAHGVIIGALRILGDISDRKRLEEQFRQAQKMEAIGRLSGGVAHDFNNLLTVIMGYGEVIMGQLRPADPMRGMIEQIHKSGERAAHLTRQLLAFSRKQVLQPVVLDLNELLSEMEKMLRRLIEEDIELKLTAGPELWFVKADLGQMEQVVMNIVINARDAMPGGGKMMIETANVQLDAEYAALHAGVQPGPYVRLAITDTGCGMDAATKARIFEPFFSTKGDKGTGLGLATVFGIVQQSGGYIDVYSEVDVGTTFKIYLPRHLADQTARNSLPGVATPGKGTETVLLVEDETEVRSLAALVLRKDGYHVLEARNGGEALLICEQTKDPIHLLVTDVIMPNMSGRQLAERLTTLRPGIKVLYVSGYTDDAVVHHGVLEAGVAFLNKPFSPVAFARKVREVLDQR